MPKSPARLVRQTDVILTPTDLPNPNDEVGRGEPLPLVLSEAPGAFSFNGLEFDVMREAGLNTLS